MKEQEKDLEYWRKNAEEDYKQVPISVLRYIAELEIAVPQVNKNESISLVSDAFLEQMKLQKEHHNEGEEREGKLRNYEKALAHRHRSGAIGDLMIKAISDR